MIYVNTRADVYLPARDGRADSRIPANTPTARPSGETWAAQVGFVRSHTGVSVAAADSLSDSVVFSLGCRVTTDGFTCDATDEDNFTVTFATEDASRTVLGVIEWTDANGSWSANFAIQSLGTEPGQFMVDTVAGAATKPVSSGSSVNPTSGVITFAFDNGAPDLASLSNLFYDPVFVSPSLYFTETSEDRPASPQIDSVITLVQSDEDVSAHYVEGCAGYTKSIREIPVGAQPGDHCKETNFWYTDATYPTKPTRIIVTDSVVTASDLA